MSYLVEKLTSVLVVALTGSYCSYILISNVDRRTWRQGKGGGNHLSGAVPQGHVRQRRKCYGWGPRNGFGPNQGGCFCQLHTSM